MLRQPYAEAVQPLQLHNVLDKVWSAGGLASAIHWLEGAESSATGGFEVAVDPT